VVDKEDLEQPMVLGLMEVVVEPDNILLSLELHNVLE
jgi:hypothetical protein